MEKADPHLTYKFMKNPDICEWIPPIFGFSFPNIPDAQIFLTQQHTLQNPLRSVYLRGMKREEWVAPIPGRPCLTGWLCGC